MSKVSFILPVYKRRFLKEAIDSILAQTCRDFELVVVDDKSPEGVYEVIKEYAWEKDFEALPDGGRMWSIDGIPVRYYQNAENIGGKDLVDAWNHAVEYATGEWCVLASDDDVYDARYLEEMVLLAQKYPSVDVIHCRIAAIDEKGKIKWLGPPRAEYETALEMMYHCGILRYAQRIPDMMFRLAALEKIGGYVWSPKAWFSDHETAIQLSFPNGAACSRNLLFFWRESSSNISMTFTDADVKIHAHELHRKWMQEKVLTLSGTNEYENYLIDCIDKGYNLTIDNLTRWVLERTPFSVWVRTLLRGDFKTPSKRRLAYERLRSCFSIRKLLSALR